MLSTKIQSVNKDFKRELEFSINNFKTYADKSRASPPVFNTGDMLWISSKNIKSRIPTKNTFRKMVVSFSNIESIQYSCLPPQWKHIHPVFHISLLEPFKVSTIPNVHPEPPPPILIEKEEEWEVSQLLDPKIKRGQLLSLVEWKGFSQDPEISTLKPTENLKNFLGFGKNFHSLYHEDLGYNSSRA
ncbi:hypothetical protein O181_043152 [Austropuccinia psidii MF-1]|uniref:Chromo domain-containing protein n=1 Tax=Austropuccinia psidii MF-1 TaxID=1389203 RepID=A0A9Q3DJZ8_9BASI|nr:hypothetical protein [Austropuccinia psidii MF-1]